ncbi:glycosyltransferase family 2 protein [Catenovulum sp. SM1970]|nr:glycosyltransferase family 2 protein [Marinifaba aquimaris]
MESTLVVIPAHNEEATIEHVIEDLKHHGFQRILVVDDASDDTTAQRVLKHGVYLLSLPYNLGAWKATQAGIRYAHDQGFENVITFDADGQHLASSLSSLLSAQKELQVDIVIGSCPKRGSFARHVAWRGFRFMSGINVKDLTSGLRLYNKAAISVLCSEAATLLEYQDVGVLLMLRTFRLTKTEVAVDMKKRVSGISRIFYSWWAVAYYMAYTTMLCLSKVAKTNTHENIKLPNRD